MQITGCTEGAFPMKYLGVPLSPTKWTKMECYGLVEKRTKKRNSWASRHLSYAGRVQLINTVLMSMHRQPFLSYLRQL